jgi:hypothetical protein
MDNNTLRNWFMDTIMKNNRTVEVMPKTFYLETISPQFRFFANGEICNFDQWYERYLSFKSNLTTIEV